MSGVREILREKPELDDMLSKKSDLDDMLSKKPEFDKMLSELPGLEKLLQDEGLKVLSRFYNYKVREKNKYAEIIPQEIERLQKKYESSCSFLPAWKIFSQFGASRAYAHYAKLMFLKEFQRILNDDLVERAPKELNELKGKLKQAYLFYPESEDEKFVHTYLENSSVPS
jgi:hypothetical protein